jgi:hypothetical protein
MDQPVWNFEQEPFGQPTDETGINLRAYFDRMPEAKMQEYRHGWTDEQLLAWDENFRDDGTLLLVCSERDVDVREYREVLEASIRYRARVRSAPTPASR